MKDHYLRILNHLWKPKSEPAQATRIEDTNKAKVTRPATELNLRELLDEETVEVLEEDKIATGG